MRQQDSQSMQKTHNSQQQILLSSRNTHSRHDLRQPATHSSSTTHHDYMREIRSNFSFTDRIASTLSTCFMNADSSYIDILDDTEKKYPPILTADTTKLLRDRILQLKIIGTSRMNLDSNIMHPFVKVHFVDKNTGCYLKVKPNDEAIVYQKQLLTYYDKLERKYCTSESDILLPLATPCCQFKKQGNSRGHWDSKFYINTPADDLITPNTIILFQVLDFNHKALLHKNEGLFRVAWAYLRPAGVSRTHLGTHKLQLYSYKYTPSDQCLSFVPNVYFDFIWPTHDKHEAYLEVQLTPVPPPRRRIVDTTSLTIFEEEAADKKYLQRYIREEKALNQPTLNPLLFKYHRKRQVCEVPDHTIHKLQSGPLGCNRVKFIGDMLFAACTMGHYTSIKGYRLDNGDIQLTLKGHSNLIYALQATPNHKYLVSGGSDNTVRVWLIPQLTQYIDEEESEEYLISQCIHTAAVYSVSLVHYTLQDQLYLLSCSYDSFIRLWKVDLKKHKHTLLQKIHTPHYPTASSYSQGTFIVGDSGGTIHVIDFNKTLNMRCTITNSQLLNDTILTIKYLSKNHIIVQASDNVIRHYELVSNKMVRIGEYTGAIFQKHMVTCQVSPDYRLLLTGSENGEPCMWDVMSGIRVELEHLHLNIIGSITGCDWHPKYNLIALCAFVQHCPIFVYGNTLGQAQLKMVVKQNQ